MSPSLLLLLLLLLLVPLSYSTGQPPFSPPSTGSPLPPSYGVSFRPSVAIVIGIFAVMFSLTFLLLMYAKFCHVAASGLFGSTGGDALDHNPFLPPPPSQPRFSGVDKILIDSLPFFRFSDLRGARDGLECAVCLSKFDDAEILRLLPKCKHAFHIACVDQWLESHSSCPLCRHRVDAQDVAAHAYSASTRMLLRSSPPSSDRRARDDLHLFVERVPSDAGQHHDDMQAVNFRLSYHKFKHRVIVSDVMMKSRWSDVSSSDLVALNSEMLRTASSRRLTGHGKPEEADERLSMKCLMPVGGRSVSEITNFSRFPEGAAAAVARGNERVRKVWLPMARRTVQWLAGREGREQLQYTREVPEV